MSTIGRTLFLHQFDNARVVGLPNGFDVKYEIKHAQSVRLATAYARMSGWKQLEEAFRHSDAKVYLLAGLDHHLTQPEVLRRWTQLSESPRVESKVYFAPTNFHPKVLIVNRVETGAPGKSRPAFAVVGSGNLSDGGLRKNIECSVFVDDDRAVRELTKWFELVFRDGRTLSHGLISDYEPHYLKARQRAKKMQRDSKKLMKSLARSAKVSSKRKLIDAVDREAKFFVVNTNSSNNEDDHHHMLLEREACAFYDPWKYEIEKIGKGDVVFLYQSNGPGIIAYGKARWQKPQKRDHHGHHSEAYCMGLEEFRGVNPPISAAEIKSMDGSGLVLRRTVEKPGASLGRRLYDAALDRST